MKTILVTVLLLLFTVCAQAQESSKDNFKLSVSFANTDYSLDNVQGIAGELDAKMFKHGNFRLGGVFRYDRSCMSCDPKIDVYSGGPQLSYDVFKGRISLFGRALFGVTTTYNQDAKLFTRTYGAGADINLGHVFVRPFVLDYVRVEGVPVTVERYGAGVGIRF